MLIGEILDDGQFQVVWQTPEAVPGDAWSDYLPGSRDLISDWTDPRRCGNYHQAQERCLATAGD